MNWRSFIAGGVCGGIVASGVFLASGFLSALDQGITVTYLSAEQDTLRAESDVLRTMAEPYWLGKSAAGAQKNLAELGLYDFYE